MPKKILLFLLFVVTNVFAFSWGRKTHNNVTLQPYTYHIFCDGGICAVNHDYDDNSFIQLLQVTYKGYSAGTFNNSFFHRVVYAGVQRTIFKKSRYMLNYIAGIMYGYKRDDGFIGGMTHGYPGPILALNNEYRVSKKIFLNAAWYGIGVTFGASINF